METDDLRLLLGGPSDLGAVVAALRRFEGMIAGQLEDVTVVSARGKDSGIFATAFGCSLTNACPMQPNCEPYD